MRLRDSVTRSPYALSTSAGDIGWKSSWPVPGTAGAGACGAGARTGAARWRRTFPTPPGIAETEGSPGSEGRPGSDGRDGSDGRLGSDGRAPPPGGTRRTTRYGLVVLT